MQHKYNYTVLVLIIVLLGYAFIASQNKWWPYESTFAPTTSVSVVKPTIKIFNAAEETKLLSERQRVTVMATQYYFLEKKLPLSMTALHTWSGVTLSKDDLEFLSQNLSWNITATKVVEVCIVPQLQFTSRTQCETLEDVNRELSGGEKR